MSTDKTWQVFSESSEATESLGEDIGRQLKGGEIIELISDLGGGKTTLVRGLVRGAGSKDRVASPTFTINREYQAGHLRIVHYDFYRLHDPGLLEFELAETLSDPKAVTVIEWADIVQDVLPDERLTIRLSSNGDGSEDSRDISMSAPASLAYLLPSKEAL